MNNRTLPSIAFVVAIIIFFGYVNPTWTGSISKARASIASDNAALKSAQEYIAKRNQLASARDKVDPSMRAKLITFLPNSVGNVRIILDLNALAARSKLSVTNIDVITNGKRNVNDGLRANINPASASDLTPVSSVDLSLSAVGTFSSLQTFLSGVERSERLLDVHDLVIKGSNTGVYRYNMTIRIYWLR